MSQNHRSGANSPPGSTAQQPDALEKKQFQEELLLLRGRILELIDIAQDNDILNESTKEQYNKTFAVNLDQLRNFRDFSRKKDKEFLLMVRLPPFVLSFQENFYDNIKRIFE